jgi:hypothetical protein
VTLALADVPYVPFAKSDRAHVAKGVKSGKAQNEQKISA